MLNNVTDNSQVDWMQLFLNRTNEQAEKFKNSLCDIEIVLQEVWLTTFWLFITEKFLISITSVIDYSK